MALSFGQEYRDLIALDPLTCSGSCMMKRRRGWSKKQSPIPFYLFDVVN